MYISLKCTQFLKINAGNSLSEGVNSPELLERSTAGKSAGDSGRRMELHQFNNKKVCALFGYPAWYFLCPKPASLFLKLHNIYIYLYLNERNSQDSQIKDAFSIP